MMTFVARLVFMLLLNIFFGFMLSYSLKFFLFYPKKEIFLFGKPLPFTPGLIPRYRKKYYNYIIYKLNRYLSELNDFSEDALTTQLEKAFKEIISKNLKNIDSQDKLSKIPASIRTKITLLIDKILDFFVKKTVRDLIPVIIEKYDFRRKIDLIAEKIDINFIFESFNKYVYKFLLIFNLAFFALIGILNVVFFTLVSVIF